MTEQPLWSNNAIATLANSITSSQTTITLTAGEGALFPSPVSGQFFTVTLISATTSTTFEIVWCTARSTDTLTVIRAKEGTTGTAFAAGDLANGLLTAGTLGLLVPWAAQGSTVYATPGTYTFTIPSTVTALDVQVWGAGGGSGGTWGTNSTSVAGAGGGYGYSYLQGVTPGATVSVTVGAGGTAGLANGGSPTAGGTGGTSSFGTYITCTGGGGGNPGNGTIGTPAATPGTSTGGQLNFAGQQGGQGYPLGSGSGGNYATGAGGGTFGTTNGQVGVSSSSIGGGPGIFPGGGCNGSALQSDGGTGAGGLVIIKY
jgi:hypothetical protein